MIKKAKIKADQMQILINKMLRILSEGKAQGGEEMVSCQS